MLAYRTKKIRETVGLWGGIHLYESQRMWAINYVSLDDKSSRIKNDSKRTCSKITVFIGL